MPEVLKCPKCDANADVTKDGKWAHCASCMYPLIFQSPILFSNFTVISFGPYQALISFLPLSLSLHVLPHRAF
ncbi:hypothetical protein D6C98_09707 [Aureobasidium pullulans]|nr:hypothetical protein D6C98_09707 [Aureobasidium pullulans]